MTEKMTVCDLCGEDIKDGRCSCGVWFNDKGECPMRQALEKFHDMKQFTLTADAPHLGCAVLFFRGDYMDCVEIEQHFCKMKGRPYYGRGEE